MAEKKIVTYKDREEAHLGHSVQLYGVKDHYRLGTQDFVITSYVVDIRDDGNTIETKNTIYKKQE